MSELRGRSRKTVVAVVILCLMLLVIARESKNCPVPRHLQNYIYGTQLPTIFAVTPTYARPVQKAELTRLSHVIILSPNVHWVIVEDADGTSNLLKNLIAQHELVERSTLLYAKTPKNFKLKSKDPKWIKPRGVEQRNKALEWIRANAKKDEHSIVYFMDDDNTYSIKLFEQMSLIEPERVGVWPVGLVGGLKVEKPLLSSDNKVTGFNSAWRPERPFPLDMAGFAISTDLLLQRPEAVFSYEVQRGYQESEILRHLTTVDKLQPLANLCREVLVWHTRTEKPNMVEEDKLLKKGKKSDDGIEV